MDIDWGYYGGMLSIGSGLDEDTRETYTEGECYLLAFALWQLGLGELVAVVPDDTEKISVLTHWSHMAVRIPEGYILDADGLNEPGLILENYGWSFDGKVKILPVNLQEYEDLIDGQAESIFGNETVMAVAEALQSWKAKLPPLKVLEG